MRHAIALLAATLVIAFAAPAAGYHHISKFGSSPSKGGSGNQFFTGSPRWKNYDCSMCHRGADTSVSTVLFGDSGGLFAQSAYVPDTVYELKMTVNSDVRTYVQLELLDDRLQPAVTKLEVKSETTQTAADEGAAGVYTLRAISGESIVFTAPKAGTGRITLYLAAISGKDDKITGDAFFLARQRFCEAGSTCDTQFEEVDLDDGVDSPASHGCVMSSGRASQTDSTKTWMFLLMGLFLCRRRLGER